MIDFDDDERRSIGGSFSGPDFSEAFNKSSDARIGIAGLESAFSAREKNNNRVSNRGEQTFSTIITEADENAFIPLVDQMVGSVFTVTLDNAREDIVLPFQHILEELHERQTDENFQQQFIFQSMFSRMTQILHKLQESTSFFIRPKSIFSKLFESAFVSRRREQMSVVNAIQEQTEFLRTGQITRERGFFESLFEPQAIGRGFLQLATGFGIGRSKAERADEKKATGEQLTLLERISAGVFKDIEFQDRTEIRTKERDMKLIDAVKNQTDDIVIALGNYTDTFLGSFGNLLTNFNDNLVSIFDNSIKPAIEGTFSRSENAAELNTPFSFNREQQEQTQRDEASLSLMQDQFAVTKEELPKLTDQMRELIKRFRGSGLFGAGAAGLSGFLFGKGAAGLAVKSKGLMGVLMGGIGAAGRKTGGVLAKGGKGFLGRMKAPGPLGAVLASLGLLGMTQNNATENLQLGGSLAGGLAGGKLGAMGGTAVAGPIGTIVGGILGSMVGFVAGENFGEMLGGFIGKVFGKKERQAEDASQGIIDSVFSRLDEDIDDQSKTGAGRFVRKVFSVGSDVMSSVWQTSKDIAGPILSSVWEVTKDSSSTAWNWIEDTLGTFASGGAKKLANSFVDSVSEVSGIIGMSILRGANVAVRDGIPAIGNMIWAVSKWVGNTYIPAMWGVFTDMIKGIGDFAWVILTRSFGWVMSKFQEIAMNAMNWIGNKTRSLFESLGLIKNPNPVTEESVMEDIRIGASIIGTPKREDGEFGGFSEMMQGFSSATQPSWINPSVGDSGFGTTHPESKIGNVNEVGSEQYRESTMRYHEEQARRIEEEANTAIQEIMNRDFLNGENMLGSLKNIEETLRRTLEENQNQSGLLKQQIQIPLPGGFGTVTIDPATAMINYGLNE